MGYLELLKILPLLVKIGIEIFKLAKGNPKADFIKEAGSVFKQINSAKNEDEKNIAIRNLQRLITKL